MHQHKFQKNHDYLNNDYFAICFLFQSINKSLPHYLISFYPCKIVVFFKLSSHKIQILQARLQRYVKHEIPDVQDSFRKGRGTRDQTANICWIIKKAREFQKNIYFCLIDYAKPLTVWITINCGKFWKRWEYQTTWPASWETCMQVRKQQLELDMEIQTGSK